MMTERLQRVVEHLATLTEAEQDAYASWLEADLQVDDQERQRIAAQLADPRETDLDRLLRQADEQVAEGKIDDLDAIL